MKYIIDCLLSLEKCKQYGEFHILVVDNGSVDGSKEAVKTQFENVQLIELATNTGFCKAVNIGIEHTTTPYVILLNNDTVVDEKFVVALEEGIEKRENIFSVSAKMIEMHNRNCMDGAGDLYCALGWGFARGKGKSIEAYQKEQSIFSACGGAAIYRMEIVKKIGLFDENHFAYLEDMDLGYRAKIFGYDNQYTPFAVVYHAGSGASGSRYNEFKIKLASKNSVYLIYKNMPLFQIILNLPFLCLGFLIKMLFFMKKGYGKLYCKGLKTGLLFCLTREAKKNKISFRWNNFKHYCRIQKQLWWNMYLRLVE